MNTKEFAEHLTALINAGGHTIDAMIARGEDIADEMRQFDKDSLVRLTEGMLVNPPSEAWATVVRALLAEVRRLRAIEPPDGYYWEIREDADGNEVSRTLRKWEPPTD